MNSSNLLTKSLSICFKTTYSTQSKSIYYLAISIVKSIEKKPNYHCTLLPDNSIQIIDHSKTRFSIEVLNNLRLVNNIALDEHYDALVINGQFVTINNQFVIGDKNHFDSSSITQGHWAINSILRQNPNCKLANNKHFNLKNCAKNFIKLLHP